MRTCKIPSAAPEGAWNSNGLAGLPNPTTPISLKRYGVEAWTVPLTTAYTRPGQNETRSSAPVIAPLAGLPPSGKVPSGMREHVSAASASGHDAAFGVGTKSPVREPQPASTRSYAPASGKDNWFIGWFR